VLPSLGLGFSLGNEKVLSALQEPVGVEIEVLQWQQDHLDLLEVSLGSPEDFAAFNLEYSEFLNEISFRVLQPQEDKLVILMIGKTPLQEPILDVVIRVRWPGGSLLQGYSLLFDPAA
jgi:pilus assembly protein FimV